MYILKIMLCTASCKTQDSGRLVAGILGVQSAVNFFVKAVLILRDVPNIFGYNSKGSITSPSICCDFVTPYLHET
jgi:hypothetical protein